MSHLASRLGVAAAAVAIGIAGAAAARADTLTDAARRLAEIRKRVELWVALEQQDPDKDTIARYRAQKEEDYKRRDRVKASDLVNIMAMKAKEDRSVRMEAAKVLGEATALSLDPDLAPPKRRGAGSKRSEFAREHLLPLLRKSDKKDGDRWTRSMANEILGKWWPQGGSQVAIGLYDADNEATWQKAHSAWGEVIKDG
jgi:hypothetical protein